MRKTRILLGITALACLVFLAWVASLSSTPRSSHPNVSIKLLGYTNDAAGNRLALVAVTNLSAAKIYIYMPRVTVPTPMQPGNFTTYILPPPFQWRAMLNGGASGNFAMPPPTNQPAWRLSFWVYNDYGTAQVIQRFLTMRRHMPATVDGDWFEDGKRP